MRKTVREAFEEASRSGLSPYGFVNSNFRFAVPTAPVSPWMVSLPVRTMEVTSPPTVSFFNVIYSHDRIVSPWKSSTKGITHAKGNLLLR
jgi:hypothetical protein